MIPGRPAEGHGGLGEHGRQGLASPPFRAAAVGRFVPEVWCVTDEADLRWMLARLGSAPFGHFKEPVRRTNSGRRACAAHVYTLHAVSARGFRSLCGEGAALGRLALSRAGSYHHPAVTNPRELADLLLEIGFGFGDRCVGGSRRRRVDAAEGSTSGTTIMTIIAKAMIKIAH